MDLQERLITIPNSVHKKSKLLSSETSSFHMKSKKNSKQSTETSFIKFIWVTPSLSPRSINKLAKLSSRSHLITWCAHTRWQFLDRSKRSSDTNIYITCSKLPNRFTHPSRTWKLEKTADCYDSKRKHRNSRTPFNYLHYPSELMKDLAISDHLKAWSS